MIGVIFSFAGVIMIITKANLEILKNLDFNESLKSLVTLSEPINIFFEKVQINDKNILLKNLNNALILCFYIQNKTS